MADTKCEAKGGTCKYTSGGCSIGRFIAKLCSGPANRQCCLPSGNVFLNSIFLFLVES